MGANDSAQVCTSNADRTDEQLTLCVYRSCCGGYVSTSRPYRLHKLTSTEPISSVFQLPTQDRLGATLLGQMGRRMPPTAVCQLPLAHCLYAETYRNRVSRLPTASLRCRSGLVKNSLTKLATREKSGYRRKTWFFLIGRTQDRCRLEKSMEKTC